MKITEEDVIEALGVLYEVMEITKRKVNGSSTPEDEARMLELDQWTKDAEKKLEEAEDE